MNCVVNQSIRSFLGLFVIGCFLLQADLKAQSIAPAGTTKADIYKKDIENRSTFLANCSKAVQSAPAALRSAATANLRSAATQTLDDKTYGSLLASSRANYANLLKAKINAPTAKLYAEAISPWQDLKTDMIDLSQVGSGPKEIQIQNYINASQYAAFWVCNLDNAPQSVTVSTSKATTISETDLYEAKYVMSRTFSYCPDVLTPVASRLTIQPGEVKLFMISQVAKKPGNEKFNIVIKGGSGTRSIPVSVSNNDLVLNKKGIDLNAVNWAYYFNPMLQGKEAQATGNLLDHYINTLVIPRTYLPTVENLTLTPEFVKYVPYCKNYENILLILDIQRQHNRKDYLSDKWKADFLKWYDLVLNEFSKQGVNPASKNIYLYLVDEPKPEEVSYMTPFISWIRKANPKIKLYATIYKKPAIDALVPLLDVSQLLSTSLMSVNVKTNDMSKIWLYDTKRRWYDPYTSYRLMAWEAFYKGYGGIGFWNYADLSKTDNNTTSSWDDFDGKYADYAAIYDQGGKFLNSRRWEAFKVGMEDYYLLQQYAKKYGNDQAKAYCYKVLSAPKNTSAADSIRNIMLSKL